MRHRNKLILFLLIYIYGCFSTAPTLLSKDENHEIVISARKLLLNNVFEITEDEKKVITEKEPEIRYYYLSGPKATQYSIMWSLNESESIGIIGVGDFFELERAKIKRVYNR